MLSWDCTITFLLIEINQKIKSRRCFCPHRKKIRSSILHVSCILPALFFRFAFFRRTCLIRSLSCKWRNAASPPGRPQRTYYLLICVRHTEMTLGTLPLTLCVQTLVTLCCACGRFMALAGEYSTKGI